MLVDVIESMMLGRDEYPKAFKSAQDFWAEFFDEHAEDDAADLAEAVDHAQTDFVWRIESDAGLVPPFAKSIMALTAIGSLYRAGFEDNRDLAERVIEAFVGSSSLSIDVKAAARDVAQMYSLDRP